MSDLYAVHWLVRPARESPNQKTLHFEVNCRIVCMGDGLGSRFVPVLSIGTSAMPTILGTYCCLLILFFNQTRFNNLHGSILEPAELPTSFLVIPVHYGVTVDGWRVSGGLLA